MIYAKHSKKLIELIATNWALSIRTLVLHSTLDLKYPGAVPIDEQVLRTGLLQLQSSGKLTRFVLICHWIPKAASNLAAR